jgi:hypothetical protein
VNMLDDLLNLIYSWGHRYLLEIGLTIVFFLLIHFIGYPFIVRRHDHAQVEHPGTPLPISPAPNQSTVITGDVSTSGSGNNVHIGPASNSSPAKQEVEK